MVNTKIKEKSYANEAEKNFITEKLLTITSLLIRFETQNANFCSLSWSLIAQILISCEVESDAVKTELILKTIIEKLFKEFLIFQDMHATLEPTGNTAILKYITNLKRQLAANVLNICRKFAPSLKSSNEEIYYKSKWKRLSIDCF